MSVLWSHATPNPAGYREVPAAALSAQLGHVRVVDVREPHEFTGELGHVRGAELVPLATVTEAAAAWDRAAEIVLVCRSGARSGQAAGTLAKAGFTQVINLSGGMLGWNAAKLEVER
jgi:rhodanese-related sulfurtransferase